MTRQEALEYVKALKDRLGQAAEKLGLEGKTGEDIVERYVMVIPDDDRKGMIFPGEKLVSYKLGNIKPDLKKTITAGLELVVSVSIPKVVIFRGEKAVSYKMGNVKLDLKKAIAAGLELVASVSIPENFLNYIQLLIVTAFFIQKSLMMEIGETEAYIVYFLNIRNGYEVGIEEKSFVEEFQKWYKQQQGVCLEEKAIQKAIQRLYDGKVADIVDGKLYLKEQVIGHVDK